MSTPVLKRNFFRDVRSDRERISDLEKEVHDPRLTPILFAPLGGIPDVNLYRNAGGYLATDNLFAALQFYAVRGVASGQVFESAVTGDAQNRFRINADGQHEWGGGAGARDVSLYRPSAGQMYMGGYQWWLTNGPSRMGFYASSIGTFIGHSNANNDYTGADSYNGYFSMGCYHPQNGYGPDVFQVDNQYVTPWAIRLGGGAYGLHVYGGRVSGSTGALTLRKVLQVHLDGYIYSYLDMTRYVSGYQSYVRYMYTDNFTNYSDDRAKEDVVQVDKAVERLGRLKGVRFRWKEDHDGKGTERAGHADMGILAQDVLKEFPELVRPRPRFAGDEREDPEPDDELMVNYLGLVAPTIEAVRELAAENKELARRLRKLENGKATA